MKDRRQEIYEAIRAADAALMHLNAAKDSLRSAGNWGIADILGGGMFITFMKRSKMERAWQEVSSARAALQFFARELSDVNEVIDLDLPADGFLEFADYFFDGAIADFMVQKRISDAAEQVSNAIYKVQQIRNSLQSLL